jgi:hypothetical protein
VPHARKGLAYFDSKYAAPTFLRERGRWVLGDLLVGAGHVDEGIATLDLTLRNQKTLATNGQSAAIADVLMSLSHAYELRGDKAVADADLQAGCGMYVAVLGAGAEPSSRCRPR